MPLILHLETNDPALGENALRRIEVERRLTIGRAGDNDLILPDPQRHLSKTHCVIDFDGKSGTVTDTSTNGVFLDENPERLQRNVPAPLAEGSVLRFGGYQISVVAIAPSFLGSPPAAAAEPRATVSPDDGLFGDPLATPPTAPDPLQGPGLTGAEMPGFGSLKAAEGFAPVIPDDADLFLRNEPAAPWPAASQPDHAPADQVFFTPPQVLRNKIPDDWDLSDLAPQTAGRPADRKLLPDMDFLAPEEQPRSPAPPPRPMAPPAAPRAGDSAAIAAFLGAVGLRDAALGEQEKIRLMRLAGETFVAMTEGITAILAARASTKQEFRIERTVIGALRNNPLKFAPSSSEAIRAMLLGNAPGFLNAKEAVGEALRDIETHQLAVIAGMQVALATVIARFDPEKLEGRLDQGSLLEGILPAARKARYWDLFKALFKEIAAELEDDFQKAFGAEFARAYRQQIERL
jgi:type VI secretion system protein